MSDYGRLLPQQLVVEVEMYIDKETADAARYDNRDLLDESGVFSLYMLAAKIYAAGYDDGARAEGERARGVRRREREADECATPPHGDGDPTEGHQR